MRSLADGALAGIRVVDLSWVIAGPWAATILSFMGAEVIKVESVNRLDLLRAAADPVTFKSVGANRSILFAQTNLNKLSTTLNLQHPKGIELVKQLVKVSDVVIEGFAPGVANKLGLGYKDLRVCKPDIVMLSTSFFGQEGPEAHYRGYAPLFTAVSGLGSLTGYQCGPPTEIRVTVDVINAISNALAILAALHYRQKTGTGQYIDASSVEGLSCLVGDYIMDYTMNGRVGLSCENRDDIMAPHGCYRCLGEDKWVSIAVSTDEEWVALYNAMGHQQLKIDRRLSDGYGRWLHRDELDRIIESWTINNSHYEVTNVLQNAGVAAIPSLSADDLFEDAHFGQRGLAQVIEHSEMGAHIVIGPPWKFSRTPAGVNKASPLLGEHNQYVLSELLGLSDSDILALNNEGVID